MISSVKDENGLKRTFDCKCQCKIDSCGDERLRMSVLVLHMCTEKWRLKNALWREIERATEHEDPEDLL